MTSTQVFDFVIIGGMRAGVFTPTEAAVVAVFYSLFVGLFIYRELDYRKVPRLMLAAAWICAGFTILSAIAYAGIFLGAMRSGRHVAP